jgi:hypothetical protein
MEEWILDSCRHTSLIIFGLTINDGKQEVLIKHNIIRKQSSEYFGEQY